MAGVVSTASEEEILRRHLLDLKKQEDMWTGYAPSREAFVDLQRELASINISFQTERSYSLKGRLMFSSQRTGGHIAIDADVPFKVMQNVTKGCLFGRDLKKVQESRSRQEKGPDWSAATFQRKKIKLQGTKKKGCTAVMHIRKVEAYPQFKINLPEKCSKRKREAASKELLSKLKVALQEEANGKLVVRQQRFYVSMSDKGSHCNHDTDADCAGYAQPVNTDVAKKIVQLVQEGVTSVRTVESCLKFYVQDVLFADRQGPSSARRDFYPTRTDIKNHVQRALRNDRCSSVDQENVAMYVEQLREKTPTTKCFFRAYQTKTTEAGLPEGDKEQLAPADADVLQTVAEECEETLLLCIQTEFMQKLLLKYSDDVVCLDATYKTTDYSLPLFLIVVKTSSHFAVVGAFVVQFETAACIEEALQIFKDWNPHLNPKYWMVDYSHAEVAALTAAFPLSRIVLCAFHREQAWNRWLIKKENDVEDITTVKKLLRQVASSTSEGELEKALENLHQSPHWQHNKKLQAYITQNWLSVLEMWVKMHRLDLPFDTNNGTESKNKTLKTCLAGNNGRRSLRGLLQALVEKFFPEKEAQLIHTNISFSPSYRLYHENVPSYLHGRPPAVIKHMMERLTRASEYRSEDVTAGSKEGTFRIKSERGIGGFHEVDFNLPSCSCLDFRKSKLPCKHFGAVFLLIDGWTFSRLPAAYKDGPYLTALNTTSGTLSGVDCEADSPKEDEQQVASGDAYGEDGAEGRAPDLSKASQQTKHHIKSQIRAKSSQVLSSLYYVHDQAALQHILSLFSEAENVAQANVTTSSGIVIRGSPTKGCSGIKRKRRTEVSVDGMKVKGLPMKKKCLSLKEHWLSRGRVGKKAEMMRGAYKASNLIQTPVVEPREQNLLLAAAQESQS